MYRSTYIVSLHHRNTRNRQCGHSVHWNLPCASCRIIATPPAYYVTGLPVLYIFCVFPLAIKQLHAISGRQPSGRFNYTTVYLAASCGWILSVYCVCFLRNIPKSRLGSALFPIHVEPTKIPVMTTALTSNLKPRRGPEARQSDEYTEEWKPKASRLVKPCNLTK